MKTVNFITTPNIWCYVHFLIFHDVCLASLYLLLFFIGRYLADSNNNIITRWYSILYDTVNLGS